MIATALLLAAAPGMETITYESGACLGTCPIYRVTVAADGHGVFEGKGFTVQGRRAFRVTPRDYAEFRRRLIAYRPVGPVDLDGPAACKSFVTDHPTITVRWSGGRWGQRYGNTELRYNTGCDLGDGGRRRRALESAPEALPIARFIRGGATPR